MVKSVNNKKKTNNTRYHSMPTIHRKWVCTESWLCSQQQQQQQQQNKKQQQQQNSLAVPENRTHVSDMTRFSIWRSTHWAIMATVVWGFNVLMA